MARLARAARPILVVGKRCSKILCPLITIPRYTQGIRPRMPCVCGIDSRHRGVKMDLWRDRQVSILCDAQLRCHFLWLMQRGGGGSSITSCLCWHCHFHNTGTRVAISRPPKESECVRFMWDRVHTRKEECPRRLPLPTDGESG